MIGLGECPVIFLHWCNFGQFGHTDKTVLVCYYLFEAVSEKAVTILEPLFLGYPHLLEGTTD